MDDELKQKVTCGLVGLLLGGAIGFSLKKFVCKKECCCETNGCKGGECCKNSGCCENSAKTPAPTKA